MNLTLRIFFLLLENKPLKNKEISKRLSTNIRNVQRIIENLKLAFDDKNNVLNRHFTFKEDGHYHTVCQNLLLKEDEILLLTKILISSRSLNETELPELVDKLIDMVGVDNHKVVKDAVASERLTQTFIDDKSFRKDKLWSLQQNISNNDKIRFQYTNHEAQEDAQTETVEISPVHTFFDNYYFFLVGLEKETHEYITYRIDWMTDIEVIHVKIGDDHSKRPNHGRDAQLNLYGYSGKKTRIYFEYYGYIGYIKDKFPSCKVIKKLDRPNRFPFSVNLIEIEVNYSDGVKLWLLGETTILRVVKPKAIADDIKKTLYDTYRLYDDEKKQ
jgi:hypothetical protein